MQQQGQFITLREGAVAKAVIAPELGGWLLRYARHLPGHGYVEALHFSQEVVDRYPQQMYAGSPLLFPLVSFNRADGHEHQYEWQGARYLMPQHGFARRSRWRIGHLTETAVSMELSETDEIHKNYPFEFLCQASYELVDGQLHFRQTIENRCPRTMPFGTGIHPYFNVPLSPQSAREHCFVELPAGRRVVPHGGWESWTAEPFPAQRLPVSHDVSDTLILTDLSEPRIRLVDDQARLSVSLDFSEAAGHRFLALWSQSTSAPFYCVEPWTALPNAFGRKETELILLEPGEVFSAAIRIEIRQH